MNKVSPVPVQLSAEERWTPYRHPQPKDLARADRAERHPGG